MKEELLVWDEKDALTLTPVGSTTLPLGEVKIPFDDPAQEVCVNNKAEKAKRCSKDKCIFKFS